MMLRWISLVPPPTVLVVAYRYALSTRPFAAAWWLPRFSCP
jgi:hypothetical protein